MKLPRRAAKPRRGGRRPGWALLTALLMFAIGAGVAVIFTDKPVYLRIGVILALWAAILAAFAALTYRRQSDVDQAKVRDQKLVYDLQLEREISARREYELTVESRLRQQLAAEIEAQTADEVAILRSELAALRTNLELLFNADLSTRPALEHDPIRSLGPWPGAEPEQVAPRYAHAVREPVEPPPAPPRHQNPEPGQPVEPLVQPVAEEQHEDDDDDTRTTEHPIIDVSADPQLLDDEDTSTPPYPEPAIRFDEPMPEPFRQPASTGSHWRPEQPAPEPAPQPTPEPRPVTWSSTAEDWDAAADGEDWDPVPQPMAPPEQPAPYHPPAAPAAQQHESAWSSSAQQWGATVSQPGGWQPAPAEGQWLPPGATGTHWAPSQEQQPPSPAPAYPQNIGGRHAGPPPAQSASSEIPDLDRLAQQPVAPQPVAPPPAAPQPAVPQFTAPETPAPGGGHRAPEPDEPVDIDSRGRRRAEETGGQSVADLLGRLQSDAGSSGGGRRRRRDD